MVIYKYDSGVELGSSENQRDLRISQSCTLITRPRCLHVAAVLPPHYSGLLESVMKLQGTRSQFAHVEKSGVNISSFHVSVCTQHVPIIAFGFLQRRRLRMHRGPEGIGQGLLMGGKSLLMVSSPYRFFAIYRSNIDC